MSIGILGRRPEKRMGSSVVAWRGSFDFSEHTKIYSLNFFCFLFFEIIVMELEKKGKREKFEVGPGDARDGV